jgi:hypothetical protein
VAAQGVAVLLGHPQRIPRRLQRRGAPQPIQLPLQRLVLLRTGHVRRLLRDAAHTKPCQSCRSRAAATPRELLTQLQAAHTAARRGTLRREHLSGWRSQTPAAAHLGCGGVGGLQLCIAPLHAGAKLRGDALITSVVNRHVAPVRLHHELEERGHLRCSAGKGRHVSR